METRAKDLVREVAKASLEVRVEVSLEGVEGVAMMTKAVIARAMMSSSDVFRQTTRQRPTQQ